MTGDKREKTFVMSRPGRERPVTYVCMGKVFEGDEKRVSRSKKGKWVDVRSALRASKFGGEGVVLTESLSLQRNRVSPSPHGESMRDNLGLALGPSDY